MYRVLICDDQPDIVNALKIYLKPEGYDLLTAQNGKEALELVQTKRLNQAAYLLENTALSVLEIGLAVGYDNQSYFHRIFQKKFGVTPKKYRDANGK